LSIRFSAVCVVCLSPTIRTAFIKRQYLPSAGAMLDAIGEVDAALVKLSNGEKANFAGL